MGNIIKKILLCLDGERHSLKAQELALELAIGLQAEITSLFVVNSYPKIFTNEIYAINREECRQYLDRSQAEEGQRALTFFENMARNAGVHYTIKMRYGLPEDEILAELREHQYDLLIMGKKKYKKFLDRLRSFNLPRKIFEETPIPVLFAVTDEY